MYNYALYYFKEAFSLKYVLLEDFPFLIVNVFARLDRMIRAIPMLSVLFMNEHKSYTKQKNVIGDRTVLEISKAMP